MALLKLNIGETVTVQANHTDPTKTRSFTIMNIDGELGLREFDTRKKMINLKNLFKKQCPLCSQWRKKKELTGVCCARGVTFMTCKACNEKMFITSMNIKTQKQSDKHWKELEKKLFKE